MKKFLMLVFVTLLTVASMAQVTSKVNSESAYLQNGSFVVAVNFNLDTVTNAMGTTGSIKSQTFDLYQVSEKSPNVLYNFNSVDFATYPASFHITKPLATSGLMIRLIGYNTSTSDTLLIDTLCNSRTGAGFTDTTGLLEFNTKKKAQHYFLHIQPGVTGLRDISGGTVSVVFPKADVIVK